ncbi:MAG: hypothetical protein JW850_04760 [Thermoflexales bacterium]|nr:hypothetical protein [Thermoflexales bacterium]
MSKRTVTTFTLGELAQRVTGGNVTAMAKLLNDAGVAPRLDENTPDPSAEVARETVMDLFAIRAGDSVGERLRVLLSETMGEAEAGV